MSQRLDPIPLSTTNSEDCSLPEILQTPEDVFLPTFPVSVSGSGTEVDNSCLKLPEDRTRRYQRRRSLSHGDVDSKSNDESYVIQPPVLTRQSPVQARTPSPCSLSENSSPATPTHVAVGPQRKVHFFFRLNAIPLKWFFVGSV